ncbi:MAG: alpha/beta hydrolase [Clostridia bacterium]|nr:alpha/beta hydrolase [Clostridia bacterium]
MKVALIIFAVVAANLLLFILSYYICNENLFRRFFGRAETDIDKRALRDTHYNPVREKMLAVTERLAAMEKTEVYITARDGVKLCADFYDRGSDTTIIFFHGFHGIPAHNFGVMIEFFINQGYDALVVDERAHYRSGGKLFSYGYHEQYDVLDWIEFAASYERTVNVFLYGSSAGAAAVGLSSDKIENEKVRGAVSDCGFVSTLELVNNICKNKRLPEFIFIDYFRKNAKKRMGLDMENAKVTDSLRNARVPFLFVHGNKDDIAPPLGSKELYDSCGSEKEIYFVEGAGHTTATVFGGEDVSEKILNFTKKYSKEKK